MKFFGFFLLLFPVLLTAQNAPFNMKQEAHRNEVGGEYNDIWGYTLEDREFAVIGSDTAIGFYDVTDCRNPILEHTIGSLPGITWRDFKSYGKYVYSVCDIRGNCPVGLGITNTEDYTTTYLTTDFARAHNIFIDVPSGRLYVVGSNTYNRGLIIYDLKNTAGSPKLLKKFLLKDYDPDFPNNGTNYYVHDAYVRGDTVYTSNAQNGLRIWDMRDLTDIELITRFDVSSGYNHSSWIDPDGNYLYVAEESFSQPLYIYDISDPTDIEVVDTWKEPLETAFGNNIAHNPFAHLNRLYISYYHDGLQVLDISDPTDVSRIAHFDTYENSSYNGFHGAWGTYPFLPSGCILISDIETGLYTVKSTLIPESRTVLDSVDLFLEEPGAGIIFSLPNESYVKLSINDSGQLVKSSYTLSSEKVKVYNSNLQFTEYGKGIILTSPDGATQQRLLFGISGVLESSPVGTFPSEVVKIQEGNVFLNQYRAGLIYYDKFLDCKHYTLNNGGVNEITNIDCH